MLDGHERLFHESELLNVNRLLGDGSDVIFLYSISLHSTGPFTVFAVV